MTLDELLGQAGMLVPAWDLRRHDEHRLCVYRIDGRAELVGAVTVQEDNYEPTNEQLRDRGLRVGNTHSGYVWIIDENGLAIWSANAKLAEGTHDELRIGAEKLRTSDVSRIETYVDPADWGYRGLRAVCGSRATFLVEERSSTPEIDPTYSGLDLDDDIAWSAFLGRDLALWLRLPYADHHGAVTNGPQLAIHVAACELADKIADVPERGELEFVFEAIGAVDGSGELVLRLAANPLEDEKRFVELRVHTRSGKSWMGRWIKQGTNRQIAAFLRSVRTPALIMRHARELRRGLVEQEYA